MTDLFFCVWFLLWRYMSVYTNIGIYMLNYFVKISKSETLSKILAETVL